MIKLYLRIGEQWSPHTATPGKQDAIESQIPSSVRMGKAADVHATGIGMPKVPHDVPVAKMQSKAATMNMIIGRKPCMEPEEAE